MAMLRAMGKCTDVPVYKHIKNSRGLRLGCSSVVKHYPAHTGSGNAMKADDLTAGSNSKPADGFLGMSPLHRNHYKNQ